MKEESIKKEGQSVYGRCMVYGRRTEVNPVLYLARNPRVWARNPRIRFQFFKDFQSNLSVPPYKKLKLILTPMIVTNKHPFNLKIENQSDPRKKIEFQFLIIFKKN
jgi:hypothetical protein